MVALQRRRGSVLVVNETPKPTTVRVDPDIRQRVDQFARETRRSFNAAVNQLLAEALDRHDIEKGITRD